MPNLIYLFAIAIGGASATAGNFALSMSIVESAMLGVLVLVFCLFLIERSLRQRAHDRLERSVQDLSRLLSTNAQAGQALSKRVSELESVDVSSRLDVVEADVSVLGTVVRQLAETVADLEDSQGHIGIKAKPEAATEEEKEIINSQAESYIEEHDQLEPVIPIELLKQAISEGRLIQYVQPIVTLPHRRTHGYDIIPHLLLEDGEVAEPHDFMPINGNGDVVRAIESASMMQAIALARRARTKGQPVSVYVPLTVATLGNQPARQQLIAQLDANQAILSDLSIKVTEADWNNLTQETEQSLEAISAKGAGFSLTRLNSLRLTFAQLMERGVTSVRVDAAKLVNEPESYTEFHTSDIVPYLQRFDMHMIVTDVTSEQHILTLLDDGVEFAMGAHIAKSGPIRTDLSSGGSRRVPVRAATVN